MCLFISTPLPQSPMTTVAICIPTAYPAFIKNTSFLVDRFHWKNHKGSLPLSAILVSLYFIGLIIDRIIVYGILYYVMASNRLLLLCYIGWSCLQLIVMAYGYGLFVIFPYANGYPWHNVNWICVNCLVLLTSCTYSLENGILSFGSHLHTT